MCTICDDPVHYAKGFCKLHYDRQYAGVAVPFDAPRRGRSPNGTPSYDRVMALSVWQGDCLVYTRATDPNGYGRVGIAGTTRSALAHRVVMEHHYGPSPLHVLHSCDNPSCVNIGHLRYGTDRDNMADAISRGRKRGRALTIDDIVAIRSDPRQQFEIAKEYGVCQSHVSRIKSGKRRR